MMSTDPDALPDDALFEILGNSRRRQLLSVLADRDDSLSLREVSREIVAHESEADSGDPDEGRVTSVYVTLYQTHVPVLEEYGVVEYDDDCTVSLGERADRVIPVLQDSEVKRSRRRQVGGYLAATLVLGGVLLVDGFRPAAVPDVVVSTLTLGAAAMLVGFAVRHC